MTADGTARGPEGLVLAAGDLTARIEGGAVRGIAFRGVEALRMIDYPVRDADWRTLDLEETDSEHGPGPSWRRDFRTVGGALSGRVAVELASESGGARLEAQLELTAERETVVNRAGFVLLHPLAGVAGEPVEVAHSDGRTEATRFPARIAPGQPVLDIAWLRHRVGPVEVAITFEGEVFEMEDQRNWTDASFKTYCRPLALPRPFTLAAGEVVRQRVGVLLRAEAGDARPPAAPDPARTTMPEITLAHEEALCGVVPQAVAAMGADEVLLRVDTDGPLELRTPVAAPVTLEIVTGADAEEGIARVADACAAVDLLPARVIALPRTYLASHQPEGPWPDGPAPMALVPLLRRTFPEAEVGGGMLTYFTEFNRCRPDPAQIDFASFGTSAIVHAADDASVLETLEALDDVFASARAIAGDRPLRLGLVAIGMRSNPYGAAVADNPEGRRVPMAMDDPRQRTPFGAAWAVAAAAVAAHSGVAAFAPAMTGGPLGMGRTGELWPIFHAVAALAALSGQPVEVKGGPAAGLVLLRGDGRRGVRGLAANLGPEPATLPDDVPARLLDATAAAEAAADPHWIDGEGRRGVRIPPLGIAMLRAP